MDDQRTDRKGGRIRFRKLRIAWSVVCGIIVLLLLALWVTSYIRGFVYMGPLGPKHYITWYSQSGQILISIVPWGGPGPESSDFIIAPYGAPDGGYAGPTRLTILQMFGFDPDEPRTLERVDNESVVCAYWIP